jgi:flavin reductase (DIM6/NTAB) family NADH-FMN oxidoreductase RutF
VFYDALTNDHGLAVDPFKALVTPRPIGWISTVSRTGAVNLAPYSFFNAFAEDPHYVAFGAGFGVRGAKDTVANVGETGEFVVNLATYDLREAMNATSALLPRGQDEFVHAGLTAVPSVVVRPPRVAESPVALECRWFKTVDLPDSDGEVANQLVIGRVVGVHIDDRYIADGRVNTVAMQPIARLGYSEYAVVNEAFRMRRPD